VPSFGDLGGRGIGEGRYYREGRAYEGDSRGGSFIGEGGADQSKVSFVASTEGGADGSSVCFAFFFEFGETFVGRIAANFG
jgi:hypothetical protein